MKQVKKLENVKNELFKRNFDFIRKAKGTVGGGTSGTGLGPLDIDIQ